MTTNEEKIREVLNYIADRDCKKGVKCEDCVYKLCAAEMAKATSSILSLIEEDKKGYVKISEVMEIIFKNAMPFPDGWRNDCVLVKDLKDEISKLGEGK